MIFVRQKLPGTGACFCPHLYKCMMDNTIGSYPLKKAARLL